MKKILITLSIALLFACSEKEVIHEDDFYMAAPFMGMKGNVESMIVSTQNIPTNPADNFLATSAVYHSFFDEEGRQDSLCLIEYKLQDTIVSSFKYYWEGKHPTKMMEVRKDRYQERIIETIYRFEDKENCTILRTDLTDDEGTTPDGWMKIDFAKGTVSRQKTMDMGVGIDMTQVFTNSYQDKRIVKTESKFDDGETSISHTKYDDNGLTASVSIISNAKSFFSSKRSKMVFTYLEFDEYDNYTKMEMEHDSKFGYTTKEKREIKYRK